MNPSARYFNYFRMFFVISILLLFAVLSCSSKNVIVTGEVIKNQPPPAEIPKNAPPVKTRPAEVMAKELKPPQIKTVEPKPTVIQPPVLSVNRNVIGCVLPLSGRYGEYGNKALDAILLSAGIFDQKNKSPWKIIVDDSHGVPEGTKESIARLANDQNVIAIIAVAGSVDAAEAANEAAKKKVPVILITAKEGLTTGSDYIFQHFLTPTQQINALAKYALDDLNCAIFSILYPKDDYGTDMASIFRNEANRIGGKVERAVAYGKNQTDFTDVLSKLVGENLVMPKKRVVDKGEQKSKPSLNFEALFIPDSYLRVKMIASQLAFYDIKGMILLGTSLWNSPELQKKGDQYLEGAVFADSFFVKSFYPETNDFIDIYYSAYSREPENIDALAYDTAGMVFNVLQNPEIKSREQFAASLVQLQNYKGATGNISFAGDRVAQKTAFILKVKNGKIEQVK